MYSRVSFSLFRFFFLFGDRVLLCCSDWPGNCYVGQIGLKAFRDVTVS